MDEQHKINFQSMKEYRNQPRKDLKDPYQLIHDPLRNRTSFKNPG